MIELFYWPTPNGHKIPLFLEEAGLEYKITPVNIGAGAQFEPEFLAISPNNRMPAIIDHAPNDGAGPLSVFESGAILEYLADKVGQFLPQQPRLRSNTLQWLHWQIGGLGPMAGQNHHFNHYAPEPIAYAQQRYINETTRLYGVLERQLEHKDYICGELSIADFACHPWVRSWQKQSQQLEDFPNLAAWFHRLEGRPAIQRAYSLATAFDGTTALTELSPEDKKRLFNLD
ncbi:glutathione binding-like protein [Ferrimonas lipolytica]|uniref:Thiol:disulfide oxidoreductase n=1 Tax=Ferrimonas lipolytica TaxID=2724191 RepID=A0A6H1UJ88_9GAMM|nr:glutathione binding-like protein [Ferrimonas lipolytica]QIZ78373.1 thiol:disulfide oxidoreductase [Ferrimonas lipolytica]